MKFTCDKCSKKYGIDNKKLENYGPSFKIKCQACSHIIVVTNPYSKKKPRLSSKEWYLFLNNEQIGPISIEQIKEYINRGELLFSTLIWKNGMPDWKQAQSVEELKHLIRLPIRTSERRKNQTEKLNMLYDEFGQSSNNIDENAFDEDEKTLSKEEFDKKKEDHLEEKNVLKTDSIEENSESVSPDDFFSKDFEEKKEDKDSKLLRSLTGNSSMGNTGIFVMYNQKRKKERITFLVLLSFIIVIGISLIIYFKNKEPKTIVKEKIKTEVKYKDRVKIVKEKVYVTVKGSDGKVRRIRKDSIVNNTKVKKDSSSANRKDKIDLYGGRNLGGTSANNKKVSIKSKTAQVNIPSGDYNNAVAAVVKDSKRGIFWCYRKELKANPNLVAKVSFKLKISASGRVNSVKSNFKPKKYNDSEMDNCMENKIKIWKFPANPDSNPINFNFSMALKAN